MATLNEDLEVLRRVPLFAALDHAKLELMAFTSKPMTFADGDLLYDTGSPSDSVFVVLDGTVEIVVQGPGGTSVIGTAYRDELVGESDALRDVNHTSSARAKGHAYALRIPHDHFLRFLSGTPSEAREVMRQLSAKLARYEHDSVAAAATLQDHKGTQG